MTNQLQHQHHDWEGDIMMFTIIKRIAQLYPWGMEIYLNEDEHEIQA